MESILLRVINIFCALSSLLSAQKTVLTAYYGLKKAAVTEKFLSLQKI